MTEQTIPAEKVRGLAELARQHNSESNPHLQASLANEICNRLQAYLLPSQQPTAGLLGRWAKHPEHGDVVCVWDKPQDGWINTYKRANNGVTGVEWYQIRFSDLTFPEQATKPEEVPAGEAWLVEQLGEGEQRAFKTDKDEWQTSSSNPLAVYNVPDDNITLISPLTPEHPGKDNLQARYDALDAKYREAVEKIKTLEQALDNLHAMKAKWRVCGDEQPDQPAWRIEAHNPDNFRVGEYIIDIDGDSGTVTPEWIELWDTDEDTFGARRFAPFIVFPNRDAATPEAIEEAKQARDKEMGE